MVSVAAASERRRGMTTSRMTCRDCGAVYERTEQEGMARDGDSYVCQVCGNELASWTGSETPAFRLISRPHEIDERR